MPTSKMIRGNRDSAAMIAGLGCSVPAGRIDRDTSAEFAVYTSNMPEPLARRVRALYRRTGIQHRGSVLIQPGKEGSNGYQEFYPPSLNAVDRGPTTADRLRRFEVEAPPLAIQAANLALKDANLAADSITHLITVTCTGFYSPGIDIDLIKSLQLLPTTERIQVGFMGCHASINALRTAKGLVCENPNRNVLVCCVELCTLHYQYGCETDHIVSNAIFADGASATVVIARGQQPNAQTTSLETQDHCHTISDNPTREPVLMHTGSTLIPDSQQAMTWRIGDNGFCMSLSAEVPDLIEQQLKPNLSAWLKTQRLHIEDIKGWGVHPGGARVLEAVQKSLQLDENDLRFSRSVLREHGNMSSATLLFILKQLRDNAVPRPWVMLGFGPGLEIEMALIH